MVCDSRTGYVKKWYMPQLEEYRKIHRIDLRDVQEDASVVGILDVGYWMQDGTYEPRIVEEV